MSDYYTHGSAPAQGAPGSSAAIRAEFDAITTAFNKLPPITGYAGLVVRVNASATGLESVSWVTILGYTPLNPANNLSDVTSPATARSNLAITPGNIGAVAAGTAVLWTSSTGSAILPSSNTANRDASPQLGYLRFNTDFSKCEVWGGSAWGGLGGATGAGGDSVFYENSKTVTASYSITSGKNAMSTGPITINAGVTVTIPSGSRWVVL